MTGIENKSKGRYASYVMSGREGNKKCLILVNLWRRTSLEDVVEANWFMDLANRFPMVIRILKGI